jgi:hypothetical protein
MTTASNYLPGAEKAQADHHEEEHDPREYLMYDPKPRGEMNDMVMESMACLSSLMLLLLLLLLLGCMLDACLDGRASTDVGLRRDGGTRWCKPPRRERQGWSEDAS